MIAATTTYLTILVQFDSTQKIGVANEAST